MRLDPKSITELKIIDDYEKALELNPNDRDIMKTLNELKNR